MNPDTTYKGKQMPDTMALVKGLGELFIQRKDVKSFQNDKGEWHPAKCSECKTAKTVCLHNPMTLRDFQEHLEGSATMGHYLINPETQTCKFFAFDLDVRKVSDEYKPTWEGVPITPRDLLHTDHPYAKALKEDLLRLAEGLARRASRVLNIQTAIVDSGGKGLHVYCFTGEIPGEAAQKLGHRLLESFRCFTPTRGQNFWRHSNPDIFQDIEIEVFPKQATVNEGSMGNLMKLPLGEHRVTGRVSTFLTTNSNPSEWTTLLPEEVLIERNQPWE